MLVEELRQSPQQLLRDAEAHPNRTPGVSAGAAPGAPNPPRPHRGATPNPTPLPHSRQADLEQSDGEEDFYYTELDVDVDSLTDGLSSLTPVSPTSSVPPAFPGPELPPFPSPEPPLGSPRSPPPPPGLCHVHTDHAYQVRLECCSVLGVLRVSVAADVVPCPQGCPAGPAGGEKRPPGPPVPGPRTAALPTLALPKPPAVPR